jgi:prepilin-type N-terminal cleavage/methylation domain-containing protein
MKSLFDLKRLWRMGKAQRAHHQAAGVNDGHAALYPSYGHPALNPAALFGRSRGFSILELLIVLLLFAVAAAVAGPAIGRLMDSLAFRESVQQLVASLQFARLTAISKGKSVQVSLTDDGLGLRLDGPVSETTTVAGGEEVQLTFEPDVLYFTPEGRATPGMVTLAIGGRTSSITLDPLTGMPMVDR